MPGKISPVRGGIGQQEFKRCGAYVDGVQKANGTAIVNGRSGRLDFRLPGGGLQEFRALSFTG